MVVTNKLILDVEWRKLHKFRVEEATQKETWVLVILNPVLHSVIELVIGSVFKHTKLDHEIETCFTSNSEYR